MGIASPEPLVSSTIPGLKSFARGKVRDLYDLGDELLIVATDRLSAFDHVLPTPIPGKGEALTRMAAFWFQRTRDIVPNHFLSIDLREMESRLPKGGRLDPAVFNGRTMLVKKARRLDYECVVRGYLAGSAWKDYVRTGSVCGHRLPAGLSLAQRLPEPVFTPTTKASVGHDLNISREELVRSAGEEMALGLERLSLRLYTQAAAYLEGRGLLLADTKFEFGLLDGKLLLIDEMVTPDSSRIWEKSLYRPGSSPESFDKQFVRDWLERSGWDQRPPAPGLPQEVVIETSRRYREALRKITA